MLAKPFATATIVKAGLVAGTLDITAAIVVATNKGYSPILIFRYIASAVFGRGAAASGWAMVAAGLLFHYLIAFIWSAIFYAMCPAVHKIIKSPVMVGLLYGMFVWVIMNLVVVPLSRIQQAPFTLSGVVREMSILMVCIGLPIAVITYKNFKQHRRTGELASLYNS